MRKSHEIKNIGKYKYYTSCRFCFSKSITQVLDLGFVPLAGGFVKKDMAHTLKKELFYPLIISFCSDCFLLQTNVVVDADVLFKNYFYHSSSINTLKNHFLEAANQIEKIKKNANFLVVEIGCNDATLICALLDKNISAVGIDPASNIVQPLIDSKLPILNEYFTKDTAKKIIRKYGKADIIFSSNTLAHIENMHEVLNGIKILLKKNGRLIFEVHYLGSIVKKMQFDMIYHEHQYYYSYMTLKKFLKQFSLEIFDVKTLNIHAGSVRYYVKHTFNNNLYVSQLVRKLGQKEKKNRFHKVDTFLSYNKKIERIKKQIQSLLIKLKGDGKRVVGYGASGRGAIVMNYCRLTKDLVEYVVDDAPAKIGSYIPGTHQKIYSSRRLYGKKKPDYVILFAWSFSSEILAKHLKYLRKGGKFIIPLPKIKIVGE